jgi:hypothetical protein
VPSRNTSWSLRYLEWMQPEREKRGKGLENRREAQAHCGPCMCVCVCVWWYFQAIADSLTLQLVHTLPQDETDWCDNHSLRGLQRPDPERP